MSQSPHVDKANLYASQVIDGTIPACWQIKAAAKRYFSDLKKSEELETYPFFFDSTAAEKVCRFVEALNHTKGKWADKKEYIVLEPWQCFFICNVFGWKRHKNGKRRFRSALLLVPRKNGKSILAAALGLYMQLADGEFGAEVYSGATTEKQAWEVFLPAKKMAETNEDLRTHYGLQVNAKALIKQSDNSKFQPVIGNPGDGASPSCAIVDEYHEHATDKMVDTMVTGMGAREQPLLLGITTAGDNLAGPCYMWQKDAERILDGTIENDELFALIYTIDKDDDWSKEETIRKANPNYGVSIDPDFLLARLKEAKDNARKQAVYQTKHLNVWVGSRQAFFNQLKWAECGNPKLQLSQFIGDPCIIGLDLSSKVDIAALSIVFTRDNGSYVVFNKHYLPESQVLISANEHYKTWDAGGWFNVTEGEMIDFRQIFDDILELCSTYKVLEVAYDPYQATMLVTELMAQGVPVIEVRPTVQNFSEPMKQLDALIRAKRLAHNGDPVLAWQIGNVVAKTDAKDNVYPRKERDESKIDGVVSLLMALGRAMTQPEEIDISDFLSNPIRG